MEELVLNQGHRAMFIPKFHCELNPIERVWCRAKQYTCSHCDYSFVNLEKIIDTALDAVSVELIRKYFRKAREYQSIKRRKHFRKRDANDFKEI